ncbi:hypothetical protein BH11VER1_BH11VER1_05480 [soil metagenome]
MHREPERLLRRPVKPMFHMLGNQRLIPIHQCHDFPVLKLQGGFSCQGNEDSDPQC